MKRNIERPIDLFDPLPPGDYLVAISASEMKDAKPKPKKKPGKYLHLTMQVLEGEFKGRIIFDFLNLVNDNKTVEENSQMTLSTICRVTGVMQPKKSEELHGKPFRVTLDIRKGTDGYDDRNSVIEYKYADGTTVRERSSPKS